MNTPIKPLADRVIAVAAATNPKTASGLYLPGNAVEKPVMATVVAVGPDVKNIKVDENIVYKEYSTTELKINEVKYLIVKEEDVLAKIDNPSVKKGAK